MTSTNKHALASSKPQLRAPPYPGPPGSGWSAAEEADILIWGHRVYQAAYAAALASRSEAPAARPNAAGQEQGWLPIATAPKDGTNVLLTNGFNVAQGWWEHQGPYIRESRDIAGVYLDQEEHDGFDGWLDCEGGMQPDPTHWMPLPKAPPLEAVGSSGMTADQAQGGKS